MASQADRLMKIGLEGFAAIDENFCRNKKRPDKKWPPVRKVPSAHPTNYYVYQANQNPATKVVNINEAAQRYGGKVYTDYPKGETSSVA